MPGEATLVFALQTVREEWREYKELKYWERQELRQLEDELGVLQSFLLESANNPEKSAYFQAREREIRNLVYEVEDTVEICLAKKAAAAAAKGKFRTRFTKKIGFRSSTMAKQVKTLRQEKVKPILSGIDGLIARLHTQGQGRLQDESNVQSSNNIQVQSSVQSSSNTQVQSSVQSSSNIDDQPVMDGYTTQPSVPSSSNIQDQPSLSSSSNIQDQPSVPSSSNIQDQPSVPSSSNIRDQPNVPSSSNIQDQPSVPSSSNIQYQARKLDNLVDFEDEASIIGYLMEPRTELDVISIVGMPGIGKTTLAKKIYEEENVHSKFQLRIWILVSQKFNSRNAFLNILGEIMPHTKGTSDLTDEKIIETLLWWLTGKEFLLVIDDLWTLEHWEMISKILPPHKKGKVLITSRQNVVATQANIYRKLHEMNLLTEDKSFDLLELKVFGKSKKIPQELVDIAKKIVAKCGRLPLAIVVIGGYLMNQFIKTCSIIGLQDIWSKVAYDVNMIFKEDEDKLISKFLELSYNELSEEMRVCFLYTGLFSDNHEIPVSTLTQLWIEEGFIRANLERSFEESADKILEKLIYMNLFVVMKKNLDQVKTCGVHDLIREYCRAKASNEGLFRVIKKSEEGVLSDSEMQEMQRFRRLCLHSNPSIFLCAEADNESRVGSNESRVRSFLSFIEEPVEVNDRPTIPFIVLRILNCKSVKFGQFPDVSSLILLKHITLSINNLDVLPKQISQLVNLRTLIVDTTSRSITVKANVWKMLQLRRFKTKAAIFLDDKNWTGKACKNLHTFSRLSPKSCKDTLEKRAPHLKILGIQGEFADLSDNFSLEKLVDLKKLKLVNELHNKSANPLFLGQPRFPPSLMSLTLSNTHLTWFDHMPVLTAMEELRMLKLKDNAFKGASWNAEGSGFEKLQFLLIEDTDLAIWSVSNAYFTRLRWLVLKKCDILHEIPKSLGTNLEKLEIDRVKKSAVDSALAIELNKKQNEQNQDSPWWVPFKLTIGPGCIL